MSRILRRPMFRGGGKVSSYGTGIASGLIHQPQGYARGGSIHTPKRGIVKGPGSYSYAENWKNIDWKNTGQNVKNTGANVVKAAKEKVAQGTSKTKNLYNKSKSFLKSKNFSEKGIMKALKKYGPRYAKNIGSFATGVGSRFPVATTLGSRLGPYYAMWKGSEVTPVDEKYGITRTENLLPMIGDTKSTMEKKALRNYEQSSNPNNFWRYDPGKWGPREDHPDYDPKKVKWNPWSEDTGAADTPIRYDSQGNIIRYNDAESMFGFKVLPKTVDQEAAAVTGIKGPPGGGDPNAYLTPKGDPVPLTMKQQVEKDKALFADLLGEGEARGKDVSDMLLRFAGSGGNTVGEKFQQYIGAEAMAGPSRTEKINQAAASLAINDYIAGKRSKENMEMMLKKTEHGVDYTLDAQKAAKNITSMDFQEALTFYAENVFKGKKGRMDPQVIKGVLSIQMPGKQINTKTFSKKSLNDIANLDATEFDIGINIVTYDGGKIILERVGESVTEVPNLFIT
tara:strand:+ start:169 stop:1695 length:1527 start_codon:yes stop_codon:yes gene_type:complete